ncbi:MAG TPA: thioredoxin domain-containing protein [Gemmatimonadaceae bacterium]|nr:thioredoxin domain-containing protein [Gemmatimonadaceae bacterium]
MVKPPPKSRGPNKLFLVILGIIAVVGVALIAMQAGGGPTPKIVAELPPGDAGKAQPYVYGKPDAPVIVAEFADFECPACAQFATLTEPDVRKRLADAGQVTFRFYDFPLEQHRNSILASLSAACAADQNKFWEMHDRIFAGQDAWASRPGESDGSANRRASRLFSAYAKQIGLDESAWSTCVEEQRHLERIQANRQLGIQRQVRSTPTFVIGNQMVPGAISYDALKRLVDETLARRDTTARSAATQ